MYSCRVVLQDRFLPIVNLICRDVALPRIKRSFQAAAQARHTPANSCCSRLAFATYGVSERIDLYSLVEGQPVIPHVDGAGIVTISELDKVIALERTVLLNGPVLKIVIALAI